MSTTVLAPAPTIEELVSMVVGDDEDDHFHCCLPDVAICGLPADNGEIAPWQPGSTVTCKTCRDIEAGRIPWSCPNCGCGAGDRCRICED